MRGAIVRGLAAGVLGTAAMTAAQVLPSKLASSGEEEQSGSSGEEPQDPWEQAPVPALAARRVANAVLGKDPSPDLIPLLTNGMHWGYGTSLGAAYGLIQERTGAPRMRSALAFGIGVMAMSYAQLVPMGLYEPPWEYSPKELAMELGYHVAYGAGLGAGHRVADAVSPGLTPIRSAISSHFQ